MNRSIQKLVWQLPSLTSGNSVYLATNNGFPKRLSDPLHTTRNFTQIIESVKANPAWPRKTIEDFEVITAEFGADFGNYKVLTTPCGQQTTKSTQSTLRPVPSHIRTPDYYKTGFPMYMAGRKQPDIKSTEEIKKLRIACQLARRILNSVAQQAKIGVSTDELDEYAHDLIIANGAFPSPLNYRKFPKSICTSVNNVACHGIPDARKLEDGDIINIDITVFINGFHGDCSDTILIGNVDPIGRNLVQVTKDCLYEGINICGPGVPFMAIGKAIQTYAEDKGFKVVPAFTGHGIGTYFHGPPDIFHFECSYDGIMQPGMTFTIEPILSQGQETIEIQEDGWTAITVDNSRTAQFEHTILITPVAAEILTQI